MSSVDVVVPCYRYGHFLRECVESVLGQSGVTVRVLIIDDASPDNTAEVAAALADQDARVTFIRHPVNKGHIATYNEGIDWACADYMLILSADDCSLPGALHRAADLMDAKPEIGFTFGNVIELRDGQIKKFPGRPGKIVKMLDRHILTGLQFIELSGVDVLVETCTAVVRTSLQKQLGGYRAELPHAGDMEMWLRFAAHASVGFVPAYQGLYRRHSASMSTACYYYAADGRFIYTSDGRLTDLQQRKVACDCFFATCRGALPDPERLRRKLYWKLGAVAVGRASAAFNEGDTDAFRQLSEFAVAVCPAIKRSFGWMKLGCKRRMGSRAWRVLRPAVAGLRGGPIDWR